MKILEQDKFDATVRFMLPSKIKSRFFAVCRSNGRKASDEMRQLVYFRLRELERLVETEG